MTVGNKSTAIADDAANVVAANKARVGKGNAFHLSISIHVTENAYVVAFCSIFIFSYS